MAYIYYNYYYNKFVPQPADVPRTQQVKQSNCCWELYIILYVYILCELVSCVLSQSAEALMLGMFPPNSSHTEVVNLHTLDFEYDYIIANAV